MGSISFTQIQDGTTADAADVNAIANTIYDEFNGNIEAANLADGAVTNAKAGFTWSTWTPTYTNITVGNGTVTARYCQVGKIVHFYWNLTMGSTTSVSNNNTISLPVTADSNYDLNANQRVAIGNATATDVGTNTYIGFLNIFSSTSTCQPLWINSAAGVATATFPFTEASGDEFSISGTYEAA